MAEGHTIKIKPMSVNDAWKGQRFKTAQYRMFEDEVFVLLPRRYQVPPEGKLEVYFVFGLSSKNCDWDNPVKPFQDILSKAYNFNDKRIYEAHCKKVDVPKGEEYIQFAIVPLEE